MSVQSELLDNLDKIHTTELGVVRIKRNLSLDTDDVVEWCKDKIKSDHAVITRNGKNWYDVEKVEVCLMDTNLNVAIAPKDSTFQVRINSEIKRAVAMLMLDLKRAEERAEIEGWIDADDLEREFYQKHNRYNKRAL